MTKKKPADEQDKRRWASHAEQLWLASQLPGFIAAQAAKTLSSYWPSVYADYWRHFKNEPTAEELAQCHGDEVLARGLPPVVTRVQKRESVSEFLAFIVRSLN